MIELIIFFILLMWYFDKEEQNKLDRAQELLTTKNQRDFYKDKLNKDKKIDLTKIPKDARNFFKDILGLSDEDAKDAWKNAQELKKEEDEMKEKVKV